jgi:hypothetical protein
MVRKKSPITSLTNYKNKKVFMKLARDYADNLPKPSVTFPNLIFLYDESLAIVDRELLFRQLDSLAKQNRQRLVVTDVGYDRTGLYIKLDEIGEGQQEVDYESLVSEWASNQS